MNFHKLLSDLPKYTTAHVHTQLIKYLLLIIRAECLASMPEVLYLIPGPPSWNMPFLRRWGQESADVQGHPQLHSKFNASPCI